MTCLRRDLGLDLVILHCLILGCAAGGGGRELLVEPARRNDTQPGGAETRALSAPFGEAEGGRVVSLPHLTSLHVPDLHRWQRVHHGRWLALEHPSSGSHLWVRFWNAGSVVKSEECAAQAQPWLPHELRSPSLSESLTRERLEYPRGFVTEVQTFLAPKEPELRGVVQAYGSQLRECFALVFTTRATGANQGRVVAARLALVVGPILESVRRLGVEDRGPARIPR